MESAGHRVDDVLKSCSKCGRFRPLSEFPRQGGKRYKQRHRAQCKDCYNAALRNSPKKSARVRRANLRRYYGFSPEQYDAMLAEQGHQCLICGVSPEHSMKGRLYVDHDHKTGKVRGLLCGLCNSGIGKLGDSIARLRAAADYLERNQ